MKAAFIRLPRGLIMIAIVLLFLAILFCVRAFIINNSAADAMAPALFGKSVVIDPGHGGWDPGMKGSSGSIEATVNLEIAQKLAEYCRQAGAFVSMTRETDNALGDTKAEDMAARVDLTEEQTLIFLSASTAIVFLGKGELRSSMSLEMKKDRHWQNPFKPVLKSS